jgi:hypothetical protein
LILLYLKDFEFDGARYLLNHFGTKRDLKGMVSAFVCTSLDHFVKGCKAWVKRTEGVFFWPDGFHCMNPARSFIFPNRIQKRMTKQISLSKEDTQKLNAEHKKMVPKLGAVALVLILFYGIVLAVSSISINSVEHLVFTVFCLVFLLVVSTIILVRRYRFSLDLQNGKKLILDGRVSSVYSKRADDYYGSFVLNGTRYYAEGANFQRIKPDAVVVVEIAPKSRIVLAVA